MPKYSQVSALHLIAALKRNGFIVHSKKGSHITLKNSVTKKRTTVPVHNKPLGRGLLGAILKQTDLLLSILDKN